MQINNLENNSRSTLVSSKEDSILNTTRSGQSTTSHPHRHVSSWDSVRVFFWFLFLNSMLATLRLTWFVAAEKNTKVWVQSDWNVHWVPCHISQPSPKLDGVRGPVLAERLQSRNKSPHFQGKHSGTSGRGSRWCSYKRAEPPTAGSCGWGGPLLVCLGSGATVRDQPADAQAPKFWIHFSESLSLAYREKHKGDC